MAAGPPAPGSGNYNPGVANALECAFEGAHATRPAPAAGRAALPRRTALLALGGLLCGPLAAAPGPADPVVLTIKGRMRAGSQVDLDMAALAALPQHSYRSSTPWYVQPREFTGPLLRELLASLGAQADTLRLTALNDYRVDMPRQDTERYDVVLARLLDGQALAVRDKGPLFVMYPYDRHPHLRSALYYSRAAWQLRSIELL